MKRSFLRYRGCFSFLRYFTKRKDDLFKGRLRSLYHLQSWVWFSWTGLPTGEPVETVRARLHVVIDGDWLGCLEAARFGGGDADGWGVEGLALDQIDTLEAQHVTEALREQLSDGLRLGESHLDLLAEEVVVEIG